MNMEKRQLVEEFLGDISCMNCVGSEASPRQAYVNRVETYLNVLGAIPPGGSRLEDICVGSFVEPWTAMQCISTGIRAEHVERCPDGEDFKYFLSEKGLEIVERVSIMDVEEFLDSCYKRVFESLLP